MISTIVKMSYTKVSQMKVSQPTMPNNFVVHYLGCMCIAYRHLSFTKVIHRCEDKNCLMLSYSGFNTVVRHNRSSKIMVLPLWAYNTVAKLTVETFQFTIPRESKSCHFCQKGVRKIRCLVYTWFKIPIVFCFSCCK